MKYDNFILKRTRWMEVLIIYFFEIEYKLKRKMSHANYLFRINQTNIEYL